MLVVFQFNQIGNASNCPPNTQINKIGIMLWPYIEGQGYIGFKDGVQVFNVTNSNLRVIMKCL